MTTYAEVIKDSISHTGERLTTVEVNLHRFVLAELNTHRVFSRNSASSRAIPVKKQLKAVTSEPALFHKWTSEQPGMSGGTELQGRDLQSAVDLYDRICAGTTAAIMEYIDKHPDESTRLHKSLLNRFLEPFMWHRVIISATEWENFFAQRCHAAAQPEFRIAAEMIKYEMGRSRPKELTPGQWHTPYIKPDEEAEMPLQVRLMVSAGRCARVSYLTHDGKRDIAADVDLYHRLTTAEPPHWSPLEHVATPAHVGKRTLGNFAGWHQLRHYGLPPVTDGRSFDKMETVETDRV